LKTLDPVNKEDLNNLELNSRIEDLTIDQINDLISRYYAGDTLKSIAKDYQIPRDNAGFAEMLPPVNIDKSCPNCFSGLLSKRPNRAFIENDPLIFCQDCSHIEKNYCSCKTCEENRRLEKIRVEKERIEKDKHKRKVIEETFSLEFRSVPESDLKFKDILYLSTLLRSGLDEDMEFITPVTSYVDKVAPTTDFTIEMLHYLTDNKLIVPTSQSDLSAFPDDKKENFPYRFYILQVVYRLNINPVDGKQKGLVQRLLYPDGDLLMNDREAALEVWKSVSLHECMAFLLHSLAKVGYSFSPGEKTFSVFEELLNHFSAAQIYGIIYKSIANTTKYEKETGINKRHAANLVINNCERFGEKAIAEKWQLTSYRRNYNLPETIVSKVLFDRILKISSLGFTEVPTRHY
jgi:hypothetical protein